LLDTIFLNMIFLKKTFAGKIAACTVVVMKIVAIQIIVILIAAIEAFPHRRIPQPTLRWPILPPSVSVKDILRDPCRPLKRLPSTFRGASLQWLCCW
jgi:hypothetical protein